MFRFLHFRGLILTAMAVIVVDPFITIDVATQSATAEERSGHHPRVSVAGPTRLDWIFALANQSPAEPPAEWLEDYDATEQQYELLVPKSYDRRKPAPLVIFISAGNGPAGGGNFRDVCEKSDALFASPFGAGNNCPMPRRVRIVMDVLDDLHRDYNIDPDRTYIGGFSGGGRVACSIAFALPEYFGGVIGVCAGGDLREETWLRHRVTDRLNVAFVTGEKDFNRSELERFRGPMLSGVGVETKVWVVPGMGHGIPNKDVLGEVLAWLDEGQARREKLAKSFPASRMDFKSPRDREEWSKVLLAEAQQRLEKPGTLYSGLIQLQGISTRWPDLASGRKAKDILIEYDARKERPWDADDIAEQRRHLIARARALDAYATGPLPPQYAKMRNAMTEAALNLWQIILQDGQDPAATRDARERIPVLKEQLENDD